MKRLFVLVALCLSAPLFAQTPSKPWATLTIKSTILAETRTVFVATPAGYGSARRRFPVIVLLDAENENQFGAAVANLRFLAGQATAIPELILVGIANGKDRAHDMSPVATGATAKEFPTAGGASKFAEFILREALPQVRAKYRTMPATYLAGHSFGGLFALHAASTRPEFSGVIAMSPSVWWNDSTPAVGYADSIGHLSHPLRLFVSSGEFEPLIDHPTRRMVARLDSMKPASLSYRYRHYNGADHGLTPLVSFIEGVQYLFEPMSTAHLPLNNLGPKSDSAEITRAYLASRATYVAGAHALGLDFGALPEDLVSGWGQFVLEAMKLPPLAVWLFRENVRDYPASAKAYYGLGDGLVAVGDTVSAIKEFRRGLAVARQLGQPDSADTKKKLAVLERGRAKSP